MTESPYVSSLAGKNDTENSDPLHSQCAGLAGS